MVHHCREEPIVQAFKAVARHRADIEGMLHTPEAWLPSRIQVNTEVSLLTGVVRVSAFETTNPTRQQDNVCEVLIFPAGEHLSLLQQQTYLESVSTISRMLGPASVQAHALVACLSPRWNRR